MPVAAQWQLSMFRTWCIHPAGTHTPHPAPAQPNCCSAFPRPTTMPAGVHCQPQPGPVQDQGHRPLLPHAEQLAEAAAHACGGAGRVDWVVRVASGCCVAADVVGTGRGASRCRLLLDGSSCTCVRHAYPAGLCSTAQTSIAQLARPSGGKWRVDALFGVWLNPTGCAPAPPALRMWTSSTWAERVRSRQGNGATCCCMLAIGRHTPPWPCNALPAVVCLGLQQRMLAVLPDAGERDCGEGRLLTCGGRRGRRAAAGRCLLHRGRAGS